MTYSPRRATLLPALAVAVLLTSATACSGRSDAANSGITDDKVTIGTTVPLSGPASVYSGSAYAAKALFDTLNDQGGVPFGDGKKRKIELVISDDQLDPSRALTAVRGLAEKDQVFAVFGQWSSGVTDATRDYLNQKKIPQILVNAPSTHVSAETDKYPWTQGFSPTATLETKVAAQLFQQLKPKAKIGVLYPQNAGGDEVVSGIEEEVRGTSMKVVTKQGYQATAPTVDSQMANLRGSGADVFINYGTAPIAAQAIKAVHELGWEPVHYVAQSSSGVETTLKPAGTGISKGIYSTAYLKDPSHPRWSDDKDVRRYIEVVSKADLDPNDMIVQQGYTEAEALIAAFAQMKEPTREELMRVMHSLDEVELGMLLPGITLSTSDDDPFLIDDLQVVRFNGTRYEPVGGVVSGGAE